MFRAFLSLHWAVSVFCLEWPSHSLPNCPSAVGVGCLLGGRVDVETWLIHVQEGEIVNQGSGQAPAPVSLSFRQT